MNTPIDPDRAVVARVLDDAPAATLAALFFAREAETAGALLAALTFATASPLEATGAVAHEVVRDYLRATGWRYSGLYGSMEMWLHASPFEDCRVFLDPTGARGFVSVALDHCALVEERPRAFILAWWLYLSHGGTP